MKAIQCDNGCEFDNSSTCTFLLMKGALLRMSCPYTSPQNGKAERIIRSINNVIRTLLFQANPPGLRAPGDPPDRPGSPAGVPAQGGLTDFGHATRGTGLHRHTTCGTTVLFRALRGLRGAATS
jgi:hypothetical protein